MNQNKLWLVLIAAACWSMTASAAPAPTPGSQGPISDALRLRGKVPATAPPMGTRVALSDENTIEVDRMAFQPITEQRTVTIEKDGKPVTVTEIVSRMVPVTYRTRAAVNKCRFFTVTKDGKLEAVETKKAVGMLKKPTVALIGDSAEVDARDLAIVKSGTLYVVLPPAMPPAVTPPSSVPAPERPVPDK